jgi:hypothetical protein
MKIKNIIFFSSTNIELDEHTKVENIFYDAIKLEGVSEFLCEIERKHRIIYHLFYRKVHKEVIRLLAKYNSYLCKQGVTMGVHYV